jgi:tRNA (guanine-N7-)-methyltransferase
VQKLISFDRLKAGHPLFVDTEGYPGWPGLFGNDRPVKLEIGFGNGSFLIELALQEPQFNFVGLDFYHKGIRKSVTKAGKLNIGNVRIAYGEARQKMAYSFKEDELEAIYINFPDPWPKKRHAKRRLIKPAFVSVLAEKLRPGGQLRLATDSEAYAAEMLDCLENESSLKNQWGARGFAGQRDDVPKTKYEKHFIAAGHKIHYLDFIKI